MFETNSAHQPFLFYFFLLSSRAGGTPKTILGNCYTAVTQQNPALIWNELKTKQMPVCAFLNSRTWKVHCISHNMIIKCWQNKLKNDQWSKTENSQYTHSLNQSENACLTQEQIVLKVVIWSKI